ncbi:MAG: hypothetical protein ABIE03_07110 [Patescibacteria group bacterium]|nr:hypothetical protein [Patescibacteria group bacterium]
METEAEKRKRLVSSVLSPDFPRDNEAFSRLTAASKLPDFEWKSIYREEREKVGQVVDESVTWEGLHNSVREKIVLMHLLGIIRSYAEEKVPKVWRFIETYIQDYHPYPQCTTLAETFEGAQYVKINPNVLLAAVTSGSSDDMAEALAGLAHEAKHLELFLYKLVRASMPPGMNPVLRDTGFEGEIAREIECYRFHEAIYRDLTGKEPRLRWEDVEEGERNFWGRHYGVSLTESSE